MPPSFPGIFEVNCLKSDSEMDTCLQTANFSPVVPRQGWQEKPSRERQDYRTYGNESSKQKCLVSVENSHLMPARRNLQRLQRVVCPKKRNLFAIYLRMP